MSAPSRGRTFWVIPLLLFLAMLLAAGLAFNLAYLDTGGDQFPGPSSPASSPANAWGLLDPQTASILFVAVVGTFVGVFVFLLVFRRKGGRGTRVVRQTSWKDMIASLLAFAMILALLLLWPQIVSRVGGPRAPGNATGNGTTSGAIIPAVGGIPLGFFLAGALLASIVALAVFLRVGFRLGRSGPMPSLRRRRLAAAQALQAAIADLQTGGDVRAVVLACYARFCYFLGVRGILAQEALTARELEGLAIADLAVSRESAESLTSLFEEARYSEHALADGDRDRALRSLERIRSDLGV